MCIPVQQTLDVLDNSRLDSVLMSIHKVFKKYNPSSNLTNSASNETKVRPGMTINLSDGEEIEVMNMGDVPVSAYKENEFQFGMLQGALNI